jgi:hypothetical protein
MKRFFTRVGAKIGRFFWSWGFLKFVLFAITLIILLYVEEDWRGARAWAATKAKWEARGVSFDFNTYLPPPVPDDQNLAALPLFKLDPDPDPDPERHGYLAPLNLHRATFEKWNVQTDANPVPPTSWLSGKTTDIKKFRLAFATEYSAMFPGQPVSQDLSAQMAIMFPFLAELRAASMARPYCRFVANYRFDVPGQNNVGGRAGAQILTSKYLTYDAISALDSSRGDQALDDIKLNTRLARGSMDQPVLVSGLVAIGMVAINLGAVYDGLATDAWSDAQLDELQRELGQLDFLDDYHQLMRGETVGVLIPAIDRVKAQWAVWLPDKNTGVDYKDNSPSLMANGWMDLWKVRSVDLNLTASEWADPKAHVFLPQKMADYQTATQKKLDGWSIYLPWNFLFRLGVTGPVFSALNKFALMQVWVDEARIACALERYRLAHNAYPATLNALVPACIDGLPHDVMNGEPYHYRLRADGKFLLYSVGWNQRDDDGVEVNMPGTSTRDYTKGDWVWPTPK